MPRVSQRPEILLALSANATASALGVNYSHIREAIDEGRLGPVRMIGAKPRILVRDIEQYFRSLPERKRRTSTNTKIKRSPDA